MIKSLLTNIARNGSASQCGLWTSRTKRCRCLVAPALLYALATGLVIGGAESPRLLDGREILSREKFWVNKDLDWYEQNIPIFECPDPEINTTYYYRWELVTRHLIYGSPASGYVFSEFADRPFWSGAYGTISCPAGLQINDVRWMRDPRYARDYVRFWMRHPGAQPRNYSFWAADSAWAVHQVQPEREFITDLLPSLAENYRKWEEIRWVEPMGLFWQSGHNDGMEFDINAQQTKDIFMGGESLRPSFNAYMWADAKAIARIATLKGDPATAERFDKKAERIKSQVQKLLWDPRRNFFFPMSNQRHEKDGFVVDKHTLTYQTGKFADSIHGRELLGYVPWFFNMPDSGFEDAWQFLMDDAFFKAPFGPTSIERNDPQFVLKDTCCWWSGQSWPFATAQTLKAMANLLQRYEQKHVDRKDYLELLHTFAATHRKDGRPYIAEAVNPFNGSWKGHDAPNHSENYFHSSFADLIITGLAGIQPSEGNTLAIDPLLPASWDYCALDRLNYHGHELSILWDKTGERYGRGMGLSVFVNGKLVKNSPELGRVTIELPNVRTIPVEQNPRINYCVNNDGDYYPRYEATYSEPGSSLAAVADGSYVYDITPSNRWTTTGSPHSQDAVVADFGTERRIDTVKVYVIDDREQGAVRAPEKIELKTWNGEAWQAVNGAKVSSSKPAGGKPFTISFPELRTSKLQVVLVHSKAGKSGVTEIEAWGPGEKDYQPVPPPSGNFAFNAGGKPFPAASASFSDQFGGVPPSAIDGKVVFAATPTNRWTSFGSPHKQDWLEIDLGAQKTVGRAVLHIYDDRGGVQAPADYWVEAWTGSEWRRLPNQMKSPDRPTGNMTNTIRFAPVSGQKFRVVFAHRGNARSGVTELELWEK